MSRIDLNIVATGNFTQVETQLARLRTQAAALSSTISGMSVFGPRATADMQTSVRLFEDSLRSTGLFQTQMVNLRSETEKFGQSLQRGNLRLGDSFRIATGHIRNQQTAISKLAREQVRLMNSTTVAMGDGKQMVITPRGIDEAINKQQILNQEYRIFRQVVANGSTQLINWGKNTQWAGRQLTVGLTVPLTIFGATASKMFMDADKQLTRLAKVYGDASKGMVDATELDSIRTETLGLAKEIASTMGVAVDQTIGIAADLAATGKEGNELLEATSEAMRLSVLGEVDRQEAMRATLSIQSVFNQDTKELAETINFLNAVENQTSTSLNDLVEGIVKAGPVVQGLGGDVEDLALMMVAMREGGIPAAEAANAIKSSLASLINPTKETRKLLNGFGIDLIEIVDKNAGNVTGTLVDLQGELANLDDISRQRAIEQIFGKFQFSRINALMSNLGKVGSQTEEVMKISGMSVQQLAETAEKELTTLTESASMKFTRALEGLKANLIPIGEVFTSVGTLLLNVANKVLEIFNSLPDPIKNFINGLMLITAVVGPIVMITGVLGNFFGYLIKGISSMMALKRAGRGVFEHFTPESIAARQASELVEKAVYDEAEAINILSAAIDKLNETLARMGGAASVAGSAMEGMAAKTLSGAEAAAVIATGGQSLIQYAGGGSKGKSYITGFERSHLTPVFGRGTREYSAQVGATLLPKIPEFSAARDYQVAERETFKPEFYDPSSGLSRTQILLQNAQTDAGRTAASGLTEQAARRLMPTRAEYNKSVSEYLGTIKMLNSLPKKQTEELRAAIREGDLDAARKELKVLLDKYEAEREKFILEEKGFVQGLTGNMEEVTSQAVDRELELTSKGPFTTTKSSEGKGPSSLIYAEAGGGVGSVEEAELTEASRAKAEALRLGADAQKRLTESDKKLKTITVKELAERNKKIESMKVTAAVEKENGRRYALINKKWYAVTGDKIRILDASNTADRNIIQSLRDRRKAELDKAKAARMAARADLEEAKASKASADADRREAVASDNAARADMAETGSRAGFMGRMRGRMSGMGGMGALSALGMATAMIPVGEPDSGASQAADVVGGIAMGAGTGAMIGSIFPGIGTAIGAAAGGIIGGLAPGLGILSSNAEKAAAELEAMRISQAAASGQLFDLEQDFLGIDIKELEDIPLEAFGTKTEEAKSKLEAFTQALQEATLAEEASLEKDRVSKIAAMTSPQELISSDMFQQMLFDAVLGGAQKEDIKLMLEGYLTVADKQYFSDRIVAYLDETIPDEGSAAKIASDYVNGLIDVSNKVLADASGGRPKVGSALSMLLQENREWERSRAGRQVDFQGRENQSLSDIISALQQDEFLMSSIISGELRQGIDLYNQGQITERTKTPAIEEGIQALRTLKIGGEGADFESLMEILSALVNISELSPDISEVASSMDDFESSVMATAESITSLLSNKDNLTEFDDILGEMNLDNLDPTVVTEISSQLNNMGDQGPELSAFFMNMVNSGLDFENVLKLLKLVLNGTISDIETLKNMSNEEIRFLITTEYRKFETGGASGIYQPSGIQDIEMPGISQLVSAATSAGGGGGGSVDTSALEEEFDKRIEQQDKIIEKIKEEREERQKLLNLQEESLNFSIKEQGLKNQIARAKAQGNLAEAALLQAQLDGERKKKRQQEEEKRRQEEEDKRIKEAEDAKKEIEEQKAAAVDAAKGSGKGGGGGGVSEDEKKRIEQRAKYLEGQLSSAITSSSEYLERAIMTRGLGGFFDSDPVKQFKEEMIKLGVPIQDVEEYLDQVFDNFIEKSDFVTTTQFEAVEKGLEDIGLEGENLQDVLPNAFAIIQDKDLTSTEKVDLLTQAFYDSGMTMDEAKAKAQSFYDKVKEAGNLGDAIRSISDAYYGVEESARKAAFEIAMLNLLSSNSNMTLAQAASLVQQDDLTRRRVLGYKSGGYISGPGGPKSDIIPALLSNGEYVIQASSVNKYGVPFLEALNKGMLPTAAMGGMISKYPSAARRMGGGGYIMNRYANGGAVNSKMAEYNISVNVAGTNASAEEIANTVMNTIKRKERMSGSVTRI